ncbi:hypothetical protein D3C80_773430 [compost metagenome]
MPGFVAVAHTEQDAELVPAKARHYVIMAARGAFDDTGDDLQQFITGVVAEAVIDALEMVDVQEHHRQHPLVGAALAQFIGENLIETATVGQVGQGVQVGHLLQRQARLVQLAEQCIHMKQVMFLALQFLVGQCRPDVAGDNQQGDAGNCQAQLQAVVCGHGQFDGMVLGYDQRQRCHGGEVHADDASCHDQAGQIFEQLMEGAVAVAKMPRQHQCTKAGENGEGDRQCKQLGIVVLHGIRLQGRHADVMHDDDAQADAGGGLQVSQWGESGLA